MCTQYILDISVFIILLILLYTSMVLLWCFPLRTNPLCWAFCDSIFIHCCLVDDAEPLTSVESSTLVVTELGAAEPLTFRKSVRHLVDLSLLASVDSFGLDINPGASNSVL